MEAFLQDSGIDYAVPLSNEFASLQQSYTGPHNNSQPSIITLPETAEHVSLIATHCIANKLQFVVRGGGHDLFGRFTSTAAVSIDLRKLNSTIVSEDKTFARVGGGATHTQVLTELAKYGLQAPVGICGDVGYASWCLVGGFGPYSSSYGIGSDQILGAKVVNANGDLVEADERLLRGLRGGGGSLAIVVELIVKVYPLQPVHAGVFVYSAGDLSQTVATFFSNYNELLMKYTELPRQLCIQPLVCPIGPFGVVTACLLIWNGEATAETFNWIDYVAGLAPLMPGLPEARSLVNLTTAHLFCIYMTEMLPRSVVGTAQAVSVKEYSPQVVEVLAKLTGALPEGFAGGFNIHTLRAESPSCSASVPDSVVPYRIPQAIFEIAGFASEEVFAGGCVEWAAELRKQLIETDAALPASYLALTAPEFIDLDKIYGKERLENLRRIKSEVDPNGVFANTVPRLV